MNLKNAPAFVREINKHHCVVTKSLYISPLSPEKMMQIVLASKNKLIEVTKWIINKDGL